jgi:hypothetical protein
MPGVKMVALFLVAAAVQAAASSQQTPSAARPDLEGVWNFATLTPLERPAAVGDKEFLTDAEATAFVRDTLERNNRDRRDGGPDVDVARAVNDGWFDRGTALARVHGRNRTSLITNPPDGHLPPLTPEARARTAAQAADIRQHPADGPENRSLQERCLAFNAGPPILPGPYNNYLQIFQFPDYVVLLTEMIHDARIVPIGSAMPARLDVPRWLGEPRGRWEGNTLVVDSLHFNGVNDVRGSDRQLHLTERFTRVDRETLLYEFTVDNPTAFVQPWSAVIPMTRSDDRIFEYACHEANYALMDILRGARAGEQR